MPRSGEEVRRRLQQAALDLYRRRGFDETTTAEIAAKAKVTERTFFRHFADKREVLFDGEAALRTLMVNAMKELPDDVAPLDTLLHAFRSAVPLVEKNRPFSEPRALVIAANAGLRERALAKVASLNEALASELRERGVIARSAALAAQVGMAAFSQAAQAWREHPSQGLDAHVVQAFDDLRELAATNAPPRPASRERAVRARIAGATTANASTRATTGVTVRRSAPHRSR